MHNQDKTMMSAAALQALKEALSVLFWYKADLGDFLVACLQEQGSVRLSAVNSTKRKIVDEVIGKLAANQQKYGSLLNKLANEVLKYKEFPHLKKLDDGEEKAKEAQAAVNALGRVYQPEEQEDEEQILRRLKRLRNKEADTQLFEQKLKDLKWLFNELEQSNSPNDRGIQFEVLLKELFDLWDLDPKASFRIEGEQIDGAFTFEGTEFLLEAKWHQEPIGRSDLDAFKAVVDRKLKNTLGLYISMSSFSKHAIGYHSNTGSSLILMNAIDLTAVLEQQVTLPELIYRKKRYAAQTGEILFTDWWAVV